MIKDLIEGKDIITVSKQVALKAFNEFQQKKMAQKKVVVDLGELIQHRSHKKKRKKLIM